MNRRNLLLCTTAVAVMSWGVCNLAAAKDSAKTKEKPKSAQLGDAGPAWSKLDGIDGKAHSLSDLKEAKAVLVVFTCNHCPVAKAYEDRLNELHHDYKDRDVALVAINVNNVEDDKLPAMKERAKEKGFKFQYLYDPSQAIGRAYGATVTPHAFILDKDRKVAYMGAIDNDQDVKKADQHFVRDALDAVLAGEKPEPAKTKQFGCGIQYE
jgi:peroxiredoxin